jgi:hypothetical protein
MMSIVATRQKERHDGWNEKGSPREQTGPGWTQRREAAAGILQPQWEDAPDASSPFQPPTADRPIVAALRLL